MRRWKFQLVGESLLSWALWCGVPAAMAQDPQLTSVFPMAGTRGTTVDLEIRGKNLVHAAGLWADCEQIHASVQGVEEIGSRRSRKPPASRPSRYATTGSNSGSTSPLRRRSAPMLSGFFRRMAFPILWRFR